MPRELTPSPLDVNQLALQLLISNAATEMEIRDDLITVHFEREVERVTFKDLGWHWTAWLGFDHFTGDTIDEALDKLVEAYKAGRLGNLPPAWKMRRRR